jgi:hypothetical protein
MCNTAHFAIAVVITSSNHKSWGNACHHETGTGKRASAESIKQYSDKTPTQQQRVLACQSLAEVANWNTLPSQPADVMPR